MRSILSVLCVLIITWNQAVLGAGPSISANQQARIDLVAASFGSRPMTVAEFLDVLSVSYSPGEMAAIRTSLGRLKTSLKMTLPSITSSPGGFKIGSLEVKVSGDGEFIIGKNHLRPEVGEKANHLFDRIVHAIETAEQKTASSFFINSAEAKGASAMPNPEINQTLKDTGKTAALGAAVGTTGAIAAILLGIGTTIVGLVTLPELLIVVGVGFVIGLIAGAAAGYKLGDLTNPRFEEKDCANEKMTVVTNKTSIQFAFKDGKLKSESGFLSTKLAAQPIEFLYKIVCENHQCAKANATLAKYNEIKATSAAGLAPAQVIDSVPAAH